jgi:3-deoxy-7-phosphoheptulonate synthase
MINNNIKKVETLPTFNQLKESFPLSSKSEETVQRGKEEVVKILLGEDNRFLVIAGPCSIHSYEEAIEIANSLNVLKEKYKDKIVILMRVCLDKPRTKKDWCGFFNDPSLDGTCDISSGYKEGRRLMSEITEMGLPIACELLTPANFNMIKDFVSYAWVGARTITSPETRNASTGLSIPVGIKNSNKDDSISDVLNAMDFIRQPSIFPTISDDGIFSKIETLGNLNTNLILRGGKSGPNYQTENVTGFVEDLNKLNLPNKIIVDCSHGNCEGDYKKQIDVVDYLIKERGSGVSNNVVGIMIESYIDGGKQNKDLKLGKIDSKEKIEPRLSLTDACISESDLEKVLEGIYLIS